MKTTKEYVPPTVEVITVEVEKGFSATGGTNVWGDGLNDFGAGGDLGSN